MSGADVDATREALAMLREHVGAWVTQPDLSRTLIAQINHADSLIVAERYEEARAAIATINAGHEAAGPQVYGAGIR